jgi:hypothetical protein
MTNLLQWITRDLLGLRVVAHAAWVSDYSSFERIDGDGLGESDLRLSASMRFDDMPVYDFPHTLPHITRIDPALAALNRQTAIRSVFSAAKVRQASTSA